MRGQFHTQPDLFATPTRLIELRGSERQKAVALLKILLTEAAAKRVSEKSTQGEGAGNEQDHA